MIGRLYRPTPAKQLNAFESVGQPSQLLADNPSLRYAKAGPKPSPTLAQQIAVIGKTQGEALRAKSARICTPTASQGQQRGQIEASSMPYWLFAGAICIGFAMVQQLDPQWDLREVDAAQAVAEERAALESREWAARQKCGPEASWRWDGDDLQCLTKHGRKTGTVSTIVAEVRQ